MGQFSVEKPGAPGSVLSGNQQDAFCASENYDALIVFRSSRPGKDTAESSNSERSSFQGADQPLLTTTGFVMVGGTIELEDGACAPDR